MTSLHWADQRHRGTAQLALKQGQEQHEENAHFGRDALTQRDEVLKLSDHIVTLHGYVESMKALLPKIERAEFRVGLRRREH